MLLFVCRTIWSVIKNATQITHRSMLPSRTLNQQMVIIYVYMYIVHRNVTRLLTFTTEHHREFYLCNSPALLSHSYQKMKHLYIVFYSVGAAYYVGNTPQVRLLLDALPACHHLLLLSLDHYLQVTSLAL